MIYRRFRRRHKQAVHTCAVLVSLSSVPLISRDLQRIAARIAERHVLRACLYRGYSIRLRLSCRSHGGTLTRPFCRAACRANAQREQGKREKYVTGISDYLLHSLRRTAFVRLFTIQVSRIPLSRYGGSAIERRGSAMRGNTLVRVRHRNAVRRERLDLRRVPCAIVPCTAWPLGSLGWFALAWDGHTITDSTRYVKGILQES